MVLQPSRRDILGPPPRDVSDLARIVKHHGSYLRSLEPGIQEGRLASLRPPRSVPSQLVGDSGGDGSADIMFLNTDVGAVPSDGADVTIRLSYEPIEGSEQVYYNGIALKRADWYRSDSLLKIPGEKWFRAGKVAWVDYAYYDQEDFETAAFDSVSVVTSDHTSVPLPGVSSYGDLLILVISAANHAGCTDPRFTAKVTSSNRGVWVGTDDGLNTPVSVYMDSVPTSGGADSVAAVMRIKGYPLLPATSEAASSGSGASFTPTIPASGSFGVMAVASGTGLVRSRISGDVLGNWTAQSIAAGDGSSGTSVFLGTATGLPAAQFTQAGSSPDYFAWVGGLQ